MQEKTGAYPGKRPSTLPPWTACSRGDGPVPLMPLATPFRYSMTSQCPHNAYSYLPLRPESDQGQTALTGGTTEGAAAMDVRYGTFVLLV